MKRRRKQDKSRQSSRCIVVGYATQAYIQKVSDLALSMETAMEQLLRSQLGYLPV